MTVRQLKQLIAYFPDDTPVVLQKDVEGNGASPLADVGEGLYEPDNSYGGTVFDVSEEEVPGDCVPCVVLWPIN